MLTIFTNLLNSIFGSRLWALFCKEVAQLLRNRQLVFTIVVSPTVLLLLFGFAFNPNLHNLKIGITDYSKSNTSREFIEVFHQANAFTINDNYVNQQSMIDSLAIGKLSVGIVIPTEFTNDVVRKHTASVQVLYDAVDANTARIASSYINELINDYNSRYLQQPSSTLQSRQAQIQTSILYNPGLKSAWFIVPGMIGVLLTVVGSQAASSLVVREKEIGTLEQLLMTPASSTEIILAKIAPLLLLLTFDIFVALTVGRIVFNLPFQGNFPEFLCIAVLYFWVSISIGIFLGAFAKSEQQAQLLAFFIIPCLILLSGAPSPTYTMPSFIQLLSYLDPLRYFVEVCRAVLLKGVGIQILWFQVLVLIGFAVILTFLSIRQFRNQLQ
ncbi:ABC transporter permease [Nostoc sp. ChiSLP03a]|uniref:ABC transporter permease n=1 Tax=Nostoc sp. ChiSLP03a TaxID=3075380 RepID=UPI002AD5248B|nr:ABC transporter permease [Nostoc sp. ChiSLP03a]MDZ8216446.1 ABC transporter permease [Nostoc sp. ChiSLP03a]